MIQNNISQQQVLKTPNRIFIGLMVLLFCLTVTFGNPYLYGEGDYSPFLYMVRVLKQADPTLFPHDPAIAAIKEFGSLFYEVFGAFFQITGIGAEQVEPVFHILTWVSRAVFMLGVFSFSWSLKKEPIAFGLLAAWCCYPIASFLGLESFIHNALFHTSVATALLLFTFAFLFKGKELLFWIGLTFILLIHLLLGAHIFLSIFPALLLIDPRITKQRVIGMTIFGIGLVLYYFWLSPPPMTPAEIQLLISLKARNATLAMPGVVGWSLMSGVILVTFLVYRRYLHGDRNQRLLMLGIVFGALSGIILSIVARAINSPHLVQLQPLRIFALTSFFCVVILCWATVQALREPSAAAYILLSVLIIMILRSVWFYAVLALALGYFAAHLSQKLLKKLKISSELFENLSKASLIGLLITMILAWLFRSSLPFEGVAETMPIIAMGLIVVLAYFPQMIRDQKQSRQLGFAIIALLITQVIVAGAFRVYARAAAEADPSWKEVTSWVRANTPKDALFITPPGPAHFRMLALRTTLSEDLNGLTWVDPSVFLELKVYFDRVNEAYDGSTWDLDSLLEAAHEWGVDYIIMHDDFAPDAPTEFQSGRYSVVKVP